jgi:hypothetical protein
VRADSPSQAPDETAGWKTCRNEKADYEFRYPPDWQVGTIGGEEPAADGYPESWTRSPKAVKVNLTNLTAALCPSPDTASIRT